MNPEIDRYEPSSIEPRLAQDWVDRGVFVADDATSKPRFYALDMFPYPSGDLHMGHLEAFTGGDVIARYRWARGFEVMHPIGWDSFGLPAENAAIKRGIDPRPWTYSNIEQQADSFKRLGYSFDWTRRLHTSDPEFYRWTQWLFLRFFDAGVAYRKTAPTNWCPSCKTVLANEQVIAGRCERCDSDVIKRDLVQWFFKETAYADRLLDDMDQLTGWSSRLLTMQRNWIGRSEGVDIRFKIEETGDTLEVYTTRPDTLWGVTFMVLAPEHPLSRALTGRAGHGAEFDGFLHKVQQRTEIERTAVGRSRLGMFSGAHAINPVNGERIPVWISDYVLMEYGTGALMAVPGHDERDYGFAKQEGLPIRFVIQPATGERLDPKTSTGPYLDEGVMDRSGPFDGTHTDGAIAKVIGYLEEQGFGTGRVRFRLRDWNVSRQRGWGAPIPIIHCPVCKEVPVPDEQLPVLLPELDDWTPPGTGESPLAKATGWVNVACPKCGHDAKRETDTFDTFVDSSWYFLRYCGAPDDAAFDREMVDRWMPADQYVGGIEHATGHLLYSRFFIKVMHDLGLVGFTEPYPNMMNQGQVIMDGAAMSKSRGNLVAPKEIFEEFGADTARVTILFAGPFDADVDWADVSPRGIHKWLNRVWRLVLTNAGTIAGAGAPSGDSPLRRATHVAIEGVTSDVERFRFNTAVSKMMILTNALSEHAATASPADVREASESLLKLLAPMAPFITHELWARLGNATDLVKEPWPEVEASLVTVDQVEMVVQVNGRVRDTIPVGVGVSEDEMVSLAKASENVGRHLEGAQIRRTVVVPPKLVNFVTG